MIDLKPIIARVRALLEEDTEASITYAALEVRLALEKVCYDRLRQRHDYISPSDMKGWNPSYVVNKIMAEVDPHLGQTMKLFIGSGTGARPNDDEYIELGTEVGFDAGRISKLWNALGGLALHVRMPRGRSDVIGDYGDKTSIRLKVEEAVGELERIAQGTMTFSGLGEEVKFECACGQENKRRSSLLQDGMVVSCFNPQCHRTFSVTKADASTVNFTLQTIDVDCASCGTTNMAPAAILLRMRVNDVTTFRCVECSYENRVAAILARGDKPD